MNKPRISLLLTTGLGLAVLLFTGCSSTSPQVAYYSLLGTEPVPASTDRHKQLVVSVGPVVLPGILKQSQIATGGAEGRYQLSEFHRWTGELDAEIARAVAEQLSARLGTEQVVVFPWDQSLKATRRIAIDVLAMGGDLGKEASLLTRWVLIDPLNEAQPAIYRSDQRTAPSGDGYPAWVMAQQQNIARLGEEITSVIMGMESP